MQTEKLNEEEGDDGDTIFNRGNHYYDGYTIGEVEVAPDLLSAIKCYHLAADLGHLEAAYNLGVVYTKGDTERGVQMDMERAICYYERAIAGGHKTSMYNLALIYHRGQNLPSVDLDKAIHYYQQASDGGMVEATYNLGVIYGNRSNTTLAIEYFQLAATAGHGPSLFNLGLIYHQGQDDIPVNISQAILYYTQAAEHGHIEASYNLAVIYDRGYENVILPDTEKAISYYQKAASGGHIESFYNLGLIYDQGQGVITADLTQAIEYYKQGGQRGNVNCLYNLAYIYHYGQDTISPDIHQALSFYEQAGKLEDVSALNALGFIYLHGYQDIIPIDVDKAITYYQEAVKLGDLSAAKNLGVIYRDGPSSFPSDITQAIQYFEIAASQSDAPACNTLAYLYHNGTQNGLTIDIERAVHWYQRSALNGDISAMFNLGLIYYTGQGNVSKDIKRAIEWYQHAAKGGMIDAMWNLALIYQYGDDSNIPINLSLAVYFYELAAQRGNMNAMYNLCVLYETKRTLLQPDIKKVLVLCQHCMKVYATTNTTTNNDIKWIQQMLLYRYGRLCILVDQLQEAEKMFMYNVSNECYLGYIGLADIKSDVRQKVRYLIQAAEQGLAEGWIGLTSYRDHTILHELWSVSKISVLHRIAKKRIQGNYNNLCVCIHVDTCYLCNNSNNDNNSTSLSPLLQLGVDRMDYTIPSSHIDCTLFQCQSQSQSQQSAVLGTGGQGQVILTKLLTKDNEWKDVALKRPIDDSLSKQAYLQEEFLYLQLFTECPYIIQCYGHTMIDNHHYIVMDAAQYGDLHTLTITQRQCNKPLILRQYLDKVSGLSLLLRWMYEISVGIAFMHEFYIRHGDIKPHNILLCNELHVKLIDMGYSNKVRLNISDIAMVKVVVGRCPKGCLSQQVLKEERKVILHLNK